VALEHASRGANVSKPSDYTAERVIEVDQPAKPDMQVLTRHLWLSRAISCLLLAVAIALIAATSGGGTSFALAAGAVVLFAGYLFIAETRARKIAVSLEKRLRLGLLVHNMELENMAMQDDLTQLFNRRYVFERLERELETAKAFQRPLSLIVIDLDSMKLVNDNFGHRLGDELLASFGRFLLDHTRASDVPARTGGDEFAIILPDTSDKAAVALRGRLIQRLDAIDLINPEDAQIKVGASFGVATYPNDGDSVDTLMQRADFDMYQQKGLHKAGVGTAEHAAAMSQPRVTGQIA
jgi:diguanylate cyclase (GGDEF)-like protein